MKILKVINYIESLLNRGRFVFRKITPTQKIKLSKDSVRPMGFQSLVERFLRLPSLMGRYLKESSMDLDNFTLLRMRPTSAAPSRMEPNMDRERASSKINW
jgi:hypothetical protein